MKTLVFIGLTGLICSCGMTGTYHSMANPAMKPELDSLGVINSYYLIIQPSPMELRKWGNVMWQHSYLGSTQGIGPQTLGKWRTSGGILTTKEPMYGEEGEVIDTMVNRYRISGDTLINIAGDAASYYIYVKRE